ncbi:MAG: hypothetical protein KF812_12985 [Fimbriimonadaceae bacterium]|nr:hypothetical protein [Fimbriimonadaceae bacterium]
MRRSFERTSLALTVIAGLTAAGCGKNSAKTKRESADSNTGADAVLIDPSREEIAAAAKPTVMVGLLELVPNVGKNTDRYEGGVAKLTLDNGRVQLLEESTGVPEKAFLPFAGKRVRIEGRLAPAYRVSVDKFDMGQHPSPPDEIGPDGSRVAGKYLTMSGLLKVERIQRE